MHHLTAIVTGASEGLGKCIAFELANYGVNLVLVSLPESGLPQLCDFIKKNYHVNVHKIETDLCRFENYESIFNELKEAGIRVDILINNAGVGNFALFLDKSLAFYKSQIQLNAMVPVLLTRLFLEQVKDNSPCYILNVGSLGGRFIMPQKQVYGATKSFVRYFTNCLRLELCDTNVSVSLLSPGGINTKPELLVLHNSLKGLSRASILEPEAVARIAIKGMFAGKKEIVPGRLNQLLVLLDSLLPAEIKDIIMKRRMKKIVSKNTHIQSAHAESLLKESMP
ncbi:SDR family NAD(P)-dependent oxidoreductase [Pedobacter sp. HMF7647]|uniref:SDR family NAD(P)-dependent oxidoreductase n=1 Tax=Hufsiella arboris TaxID=2695275 RepID=A0A7K1Y7V1_9SPHI|nr:SDR family NAD(P)-dependent oxidoreductase [Hufsiella arboris]MXV50500.1 SDR family NAD(P)-dependent oxidoreductase [Hufsiella arboris]